MSKSYFVIRHEDPMLTTEVLASQLNGDGRSFDVFHHAPEDRAARVVSECADESEVQGCCDALRAKGFAVLTYGNHVPRPINNKPREPIWSVPIE